MINKNQIENINTQNDKKNNENIVIINKDKCKSYNIVKSKNKKNKNISVNLECRMLIAQVIVQFIKKKITIY